MSCATCHEPKRGFSDGRRVPIGITGERHHRNAMTLANVGYFRTLTWVDPEQTRLEEQLLRPLFGTSPVEMGALGHERPILEHIESNSVYRALFARAFPGNRRPYRLCQHRQGDRRLSAHAGLGHLAL